MDANMTNNELIGLGEREAQRLNDENDHCGATIMRELCRRLHGNDGPCGKVTMNVDGKSLERLAAVIAADRLAFEGSIKTLIAKGMSRGGIV